MYSKRASAQTAAAGAFSASAWPPVVLQHDSRLYIVLQSFFLLVVNVVRIMLKTRSTAQLDGTMRKTSAARLDHAGNVLASSAHQAASLALLPPAAASTAGELPLAAALPLALLPCSGEKNAEMDPRLASGAPAPASAAAEPPTRAAGVVACASEAPPKAPSAKARSRMAVQPTQ